MSTKQVLESIDRIMRSTYATPYGRGLVSQSAREYGYGYGNVGGCYDDGYGGCYEPSMYGSGRKAKFFLHSESGKKVYNMRTSSHLLNRHLGNLAKRQGLEGRAKSDYKLDQIVDLNNKGVIGDRQATYMIKKIETGRRNLPKALDKLCSDEMGLTRVSRMRRRPQRQPPAIPQELLL